MINDYRQKVSNSPNGVLKNLSGVSCSGYRMKSLHCLTLMKPRKGVAKDYEWMVKKNFLLSPLYLFDQTFGDVVLQTAIITTYPNLNLQLMLNIYLCPHCICHSLYDHFILCIKAGCTASVPVRQISGESLWMSGRGNKAQQFTLVFWGVFCIVTAHVTAEQKIYFYVIIHRQRLSQETETCVGHNIWFVY